MQIFVGLGNPGAGYAKHRHNIGFMAVDAIAERHGFGPERKRFQGATREGLVEGTVGATKLLILKPQTYMNLSGHSVGEALTFFKLAPEAVTVFHDELDLAPGRVKVKTGGGHAGHNGLRSMIAQIGPGFRRVRLGIGHPGDKSLVSNYVLSDFAKADQPWLAALLDEMAREAGLLVAGRDTDFMTRLAERLKDLVPDAAGRSSAGE